MNSLQSIEKYLKKSAYSLLLPQNSSSNEDVRTVIFNHFMSLIGWNALNKNETRTVYDEKLGKNKQIQIDYWGDYECPLKDKKKDVVYINTDLVAQYPTDYQTILKNDSYNVEYIRDCLIRENKIDTDNSIEHCVQFILSLNEAEKGSSLPDIKDAFKDRLLNKDIIFIEATDKNDSILCYNVNGELF